MAEVRNISVGENISSEQRQLLRRARHESTAEAVDALYRVVRDTDIGDGREQLHPDWFDVFERHSANLAEYVPTEIFREFQAFFTAFSPIDSAASSIDFGAVTTAFLLGAGASKPAPSNIPTVKELLPELLARARRLDREDLNRLADFCERTRIENIEDLLTAAQLATFTSRSPIVQRLINFLLYRADDEQGSAQRRRSAGDESAVAFLQDTLQVLFGLLSSTMLPAQPNAAHEAISTYAKSKPGTVIVTTNYDCCMDLALGDEAKDFEYALDFSNAPRMVTAPGLTQLIKLHGSLNWFYCETCQKIQRTDIRRTVKNFLEDVEPYPIIAICKDCGGQRRGLLVPPLAMKFDVAPPLMPLTGKAANAFEKADIIVVVGYSFADADLHITRMISKSLQRKSTQRVAILDPDRGIAEKLRRRLKSSIPNFETSRILRLAGDASVVLPQFLAGRLAKSGELPARKAKRVA